MRNGDFSALLAQGIPIYDPDTARARERPRRTDAVPRQHHSDQPPQPDRAGDVEVLPAAEPGRGQRDEQLLLHEPAGDDFYSIYYRVDHRLTDKQRSSCATSRNNRTEARGNWSGR